MNKLSVNLKELYNAMGIVMKAIDHRSGADILRCVHLRAYARLLTLTGTDLNHRFAAYLAADGEIDVCVNARNLYNTLRVGHKRDDVHIITSDDAKVIINCDGQSTTLETRNADDYPTAPDMPNIKRVGGVDASELGAALKYTLPAVSRDDTRPQLGGVYFDPEAGAVVTTDGHRMHIFKLAGTCEDSIFLDRSSAALLYEVLKKCDVAEVFRSGDFVQIEADGRKLMMRVLGENFPPYKKVIPNTHNAAVTLTIDVKEFTRALKIVKGDIQDNLQMRINGKEIVLYASTGEIEKTNTFSALGSTCSENKNYVIGYNYKYMLDAIAGSHTVNIFFPHDNLGPIVVSGDKGQMAVVMPTRI